MPPADYVPSWGHSSPSTIRMPNKRTTSGTYPSTLPILHRLGSIIQAQQLMIAAKNDIEIPQLGLQTTLIEEERGKWLWSTSYRSAQLAIKNLSAELEDPKDSTHTEKKREVTIQRQHFIMAICNGNPPGGSSK
ncbi:hypothetical protein OUZ56_021972 [Daphnia magna]|uniref:Uncharacterized protein n=1 Tax=Daphnia magna TaxID=35525 RepID=A0ABR0AUZ8_9CRUS|nr:hypothetical protein OUZ56_021972 [Daphnia magna]